MFGTIGLSSFLMLPLVAGAGMALMGFGAVIGPTVLLAMPFMLARV